MSSPYKVIITPEAEEDLKKIDKTFRDALLSGIRRIKDNPKLGKMLKRELKGQRRLRISRYRIFYEIDEKAKTVWILIIDHRKDAYR